jgi:glyoxylate/hydroxypyruvate reductase A
VAGAGELGLAVSARLLGQGYRVATWGRTARTRTLPPAAAGQAGHWQAAHGPDAWAALARQADVVINLMPLTPGTRGWFDAPRFAGFKPGAGFVNLARGAAVVEADLLAALDAGQLGHAVLDVFAHEPLPDSHAFWTHPRVSVLPHVAALTDPRSAALVAAANVRAVRLASGAVIGTSGGDDEGGPGDHGSPGGQGEQAQPGTSRAPGAVTTGLSGLVDRLRGY